MAWSQSNGAKPWWFSVLQQLDSDTDSDDSTYTVASAPGDNPDLSDDESIDLTHTDDETESEVSEHTSDEEFIDDE
eukprot:SAG25_NODE_772_length_5439_cov_2.322097_2_plen_76_part_00